MTSSNPAIPALTGLRFIAAISVALAHGGTLLLKTAGGQNLIQAYMTSAAGFGMSLFFTLSGFVIHYNYRDNVLSERGMGFIRFMWSRFSRLYPLFLFMIFVDLITSKQLFLAVSGTGRIADDLSHALPLYFTLLHSWIYDVNSSNALIYQIGRNTAVTWSVSTEWFFYIAYPLILLALMRIRSMRGAIISIAIFCVVWSSLCIVLYDNFKPLDSWAIEKFGTIAGIKNSAQDSFVRWAIYFNPYTRIGEFMLGCLTAQAYLLLRDRPVSGTEARWGRISTSLMPFVILAAVILSRHPEIPGNIFHKMSNNFGFAPAIAALIFLCARHSSALASFLGSRPLIALGDASYSIYLTHFLIFFAVSGYDEVPLALSPETGAFLTLRFMFPWERSFCFPLRFTPPWKRPRGTGCAVFCPRRIRDHGPGLGARPSALPPYRPCLGRCSGPSVPIKGRALPCCAPPMAPIAEA
jgi:peptidoglycan/LPS O-acetylase OafA/YrhL